MTHDLTPTDTEATAEGLRAELEGLVRIAARRPGLTVREGQPGCGWSFSWDSDVVTVDPDHLRSFAPDLCRGLALHEASHAAVTVLHQILPPALLSRLHPLLNTIEDIRIEVWMRSRFPGAAAWIRAYNDVFHGFNRGQVLPRSRQVQFLIGILELWWYGTASPATLPEVLAALDDCREPIAAATACQPPLDDDPQAIVASQRAMWEIVRQRILPTWDRLVMLDRREGIGSLASYEMQTFVEATGCGIHGKTNHRNGRPRAQERVVRAPSGEPGPVATPVDGTDCYLLAWKRIAPAADRLGEELLRVLVPRQRLRWSSGHPWGPRLDLRRAMQFEADRQTYRSLWSRPILPHRRDPAVLLLVDRSSSMIQDGLADRALEGTVLLTEVCRRIGVASAVWSFAADVREELAWDAPIDGQARRRIGLMPDTCRGNTNMAGALSAVDRAFASRRGDPKILFVIGDGAPDNHSATLAAVGRLDANGIVTVGLGLGPGTAGLARFFQCSVTEIPPEQLVDHVADLLGEALMAHV